MKAKDPNNTVKATPCKFLANSNRHWYIEDDIQSKLLRCIKDKIGIYSLSLELNTINQEKANTNRVQYTC